MATASEIICKEYRKIITGKYPEYVYTWPILAGHNIVNGEYKGYIICIFKHTGNSGMVSSNVAQFNSEIVGESIITKDNINGVRERIREKFNLNRMDSVVILNMDGSNLDSELNKLLFNHEVIMGVIKMKIFLSHKGADKTMIREYSAILTEMGFDVWLDEDAMPAGTALHRGILQGFKDSCAAIFFITPNYIDEGFLETEINYAITEKMSKKDRFSIITLVFEHEGKTGEVPEILKPYVWKQPKSDLQAIQEIIKSLPIKLGKPNYR